MFFHISFCNFPNLFAFSVILGLQNIANLRKSNPVVAQPNLQVPQILSDVCYCR